MTYAPIYVKNSSPPKYYYLGYCQCFICNNEVVEVVKLKIFRNKKKLDYRTACAECFFASPVIDDLASFKANSWDVVACIVDELPEGCEPAFFSLDTRQAGSSYDLVVLGDADVVDKTSRLVRQSWEGVSVGSVDQDRLYELDNNRLVQNQERGMVFLEKFKGATQLLGEVPKLLLGVKK